MTKELILLEKHLKRATRQNPSVRVIFYQIRLHLMKMAKRMLDVTGSLALMVLLSPLLLFTMAAIWLENPGPVFYSQIRIGKNGRPFKFYKFRSMVMNADALKDQFLHLNESGDGVIFKMKRDPRVTRVGRFIRRFSIDELPQLFNVLKGDMSLVGPRPPVPREVELYSIEERKRLHITPGITCIWQVSGRSDIPFQQQVQMDLAYIHRHGLLQDVKLLLRTVGAVFSGRGAY